MGVSAGDGADDGHPRTARRAVLSAAQPSSVTVMLRFFLRVVVQHALAHQGVDVLADRRRERRRQQNFGDFRATGLSSASLGIGNAE